MSKSIHFCMKQISIEHLQHVIDYALSCINRYINNALDVNESCSNTNNSCRTKSKLVQNYTYTSIPEVLGKRLCRYLLTIYKGIKCANSLIFLGQSSVIQLLKDFLNIIHFYCYFQLIWCQNFLLQLKLYWTDISIDLEMIYE